VLEDSKRKGKSWQEINNKKKGLWEGGRAWGLFIHQPI
jgi:hypothetical protein